MRPKQPDRYSFIDAYLLEELRREYAASSSRERLRLLAKLKSRHIPVEIALLAVEDPDARVRAWFAKNGAPLQFGAREDLPNYHDLEARLLEDPDPYVRACVYENPRFGGFKHLNQPIELFLEAAPLERLALMRNPEVGEKLIEQIFLYDETQLGITLAERRDLVRAFLSNTEVIKKSHKGSSDFSDGPDWASTTSHFTRLWQHISAWPSDEESLKCFVYKTVGTDDVTRATALRESKDETTRWTILVGCDPNRHTDTLRFGRRDKDPSCRATAYQRSRLTKEQVAEALADTDTAALQGLALNHLLSVEELGSVSERLYELGDVDHADDVLVTIRQLEQTYPPKDPHKLFGYEGKQGNFLEEKINYIGRTLIRWQENIDDALADQDNRGELSQVLTFLKRILR
jgi:hypothetical protein